MSLLQRLLLPSPDPIRLCLALLALGPAVTACQKSPALPAGSQIAVMTALPLFGTSADPATILNGPDQRAAIIRTLSARYEVVPLARLDEESLASNHILILAQPRALSGQELVALDAWVRRGGRALVFTDPELLWPSDLPLGDPRRAPSIGLLDPLLAHWGLVLESAEMNDAGPKQSYDVGNMEIAVAWAGNWRVVKPGCRVEAERLIANCRIGKGHALLIADADMLDERLWQESGTDNESAILALFDRVATGN